MDYAELPLPMELGGWVAAIWTAAVPSAGPAWVESKAVPDGCIELIRRTEGRSVWRNEQPAVFATELSTVPAELRLGAGSGFVGAKLWPWAWRALGGEPCRSFADDWIAVPEGSPMADLVEGAPGEIRARLTDVFRGRRPPAVALALLTETSVAAVARTAGLSHRRLQRLFEREYGIAPRSYLRLLRLRNTMASVGNDRTLADIAADEGYADQAHMARDFRSLAGLPPSTARSRARGPFV